MKDSMFQKLVKEAILELPEKIPQEIDHCAICIERRPTSEQLRKKAQETLGLYCIGISIVC